MFHQLHCLGMIRELVLRGTLGGDASIAQMNPDDSDDKDEEPHWLHCFNYIAEVSNIDRPKSMIISLDLLDKAAAL